MSENVLEPDLKAKAELSDVSHLYRHKDTSVCKNVYIQAVHFFWHEQTFDPL